MSMKFAEVTSKPSFGSISALGDKNQGQKVFMDFRVIPCGYPME